MSETTKIEWCDATVNYWSGCEKISPGCANCYAEKLARINGHYGKWGKDAPRAWHKGGAEMVRRLNRTAGKSGRRLRVFVNSMSDWLDDAVPLEWLAELLDSIRCAPHLDFLLLTKRPENFRKRLGGIVNEIAASIEVTQFACDWMGEKGCRVLKRVEPAPPPNVWIGTTVEDQPRADSRIPRLLDIPAAVRFLSCEPLLGPVDLHSAHIKVATWQVGESFDGPSPLEGIHWVIAGGESGSQARPMHPEWVRSLRDQCQAAGVPFLFKQWGEWLPIGPVYQRDDDENTGDPDRQILVENDGCVAVGLGDWVTGRDYQPNPSKNPWILERVGKKHSGRLLDARAWNEFPKGGLP